MSAVTQSLDEFLDKYSDKRSSEWLFMSSPYPTLTIVVIYLSLVYGILPAFMKYRKPYDLTKIIRVYNLFQIASCAFLIYWVATCGWIQGDLSWGCQPPDFSNKPQAISMLRGFHFTYFLKMTELIETVFFLLRKKNNQVTNLHVYHHASTFTLTWIGTKFVGGGMASVPIMMNSFIHILMYSYYYLASLGPKWQKSLAPWKPRLTMAQMIQFTILIIHAMGSLQPGCDVPHKFLLLYIPNLVVIYKMFYDFYQKSYTKPESKSKQSKKH